MKSITSRPTTVASFIHRVVPNWKSGIIVLATVAVIVCIMTGVPPSTPTINKNATVAANMSATPIWQSLLLWSIVGFTYCSLMHSLWTGEARGHWHFFRKLNLWSILSSIPVFCIVVLVAVLLSRFPILNRSWMYHLSSSSGNVSTIGFSIPYLGLALLSILFVSLPSLAFSEEVLFRKGTNGWVDACWRSLAFGLVHCFVGVPLHTGMALSIAGLWFSFHYFRGGVERSTIYHLSYNVFILALLAFIMCLT